jgi:hypothetical protein
MGREPPKFVSKGTVVPSRPGTRQASSSSETANHGFRQGIRSQALEKRIPFPFLERSRASIVEMRLFGDPRSDVPSEITMLAVVAQNSGEAPVTEETSRRCEKEFGSHLR